MCKHFPAPCSWSPEAPSYKQCWSAVLCFCKYKTENLCNYLWSRRSCAAWQNSMCRKHFVRSLLTNFPLYTVFFFSPCSLSGLTPFMPIFSPPIPVWKYTSGFSAEIEAEVPNPLRASHGKKRWWRQLTEKREKKGDAMNKVGICFSKQLMRLSRFHHEFWYEGVKIVLAHAESSSPQTKKSFLGLSH